ncbi:hypothetical protein BV372_18765 [Nostoc sp. T09]|nr:hypothetical protein BV372_18765 [Nostoc sp. T09]
MNHRIYFKNFKPIFQYYRCLGIKGNGDKKDKQFKMKTLDMYFIIDQCQMTIDAKSHPFSRMG